MSREIKFQLVLGDMIIAVDHIEWRKGKPYRAGYFDKEADRIRWFYLGTKLDYKLREYTGLKDKNGREIYEGDILAAKFNGGYVERVHWKGPPDVIAEVFWSYAGYQLNCHGDKDRRYASLSDFLDEQDFPKNGEMVMISLSHTEIIGNIYENPELLK